MVTDAAAPALQRIERAAIAASTQITYPPHELLRLIQVGHTLLHTHVNAKAPSVPPSRQEPHRNSKSRYSAVNAKVECVWKY